MLSHGGAAPVKHDIGPHLTACNAAIGLRVVIGLAVGFSGSLRWLAALPRLDALVVGCVSAKPLMFGHRLSDVDVQFGIGRNALALVLGHGAGQYHSPEIPHRGIESAGRLLLLLARTGAAGCRP